MKKKIYIYLVAALCFGGTAFGQDHHDVKLDADCSLIDAVNINNGLVLLTGRNYYYRSGVDWKISYYTPHLAQRYEVAVPGAPAFPMFPRYFGNLNYGGQLSNSISDVFYPGFLVVSPSGNNVYYIRHGRGGMFSGSVNTQKVMHIDSAGLTSSFTMKGRLKYKQVNVVFADDDNLYYVTKDKVKKKRHHQAKPKLHFIRVAANYFIFQCWKTHPLPPPAGDSS